MRDWSWKQVRPPKFKIGQTVYSVGGGRVFTLTIIGIHVEIFKGGSSYRYCVTGGNCSPWENINEEVLFASKKEANIEAKINVKFWQIQKLYNSKEYWQHKLKALEVYSKEFVQKEISALEEEIQKEEKKLSKLEEKRNEQT